MLIKQLTKADGEQVCIVVKNVEAATMTTGLGVAFQATTSCDGINAVISQATTYNATFCGIARQDIPVNGYGTVVCWGIADSINLSNAGTSITIGIGNALWPSVAGRFYSTNPTTDLSTLKVTNVIQWKPYIIATSTANVSALAYVSGLVRAL